MANILYKRKNAYIVNNTLKHNKTGYLPMGTSWQSFKLVWFIL